ncbi:MAG: hypothetical protein K8T20_10360 [Planctomycetes bacterium]|nr:hypothetical protein [Planctomycetota bacterium]
MLKFLTLGLSVALLAGCSTATKPAADFDPSWCEVSELHAADGTVLWIYTSPQGNLIVARGADGRLVATGSGREVTTCIEDATKALQSRK